jgi:hypothetical protein
MPKAYFTLITISFAPMKFIRSFVIYTFINLLYFTIAQSIELIYIAHYMAVLILGKS